MTKQEKIKAKSHQLIEAGLIIDGGKAFFSLEGLQRLFAYLHLKGVGIKVECSQCKGEGHYSILLPDEVSSPCTIICEVCMGTGYTTEPLI